MRLAFTLFKYFPYGGLQKDMLAIAEQCHQRGAAVTAYCRSWRGDMPHWLTVRVIEAKGLGNHRRDLSFYEELQPILRRERYDRVVGFNKMPGLDIYYAADSCYMAKAHEERSFLTRLTARYRHYSRFEAATFGPDGAPVILMISRPEIAVFQRYYGTAESRFQMLLPGIRRDRILPEDWAARRLATRQQWGIGDHERLILFVGSGFRTKGLDRAIRAISALPGDIRRRVRFLVIGDDRDRQFRRLAAWSGIGEQTRFLGGRDDVPEFLWAADLLLHPAYRENAGMVLLEAMVAGLPVLTTSACGYASYVADNGMGTVMPEHFTLSELTAAMVELLHRPDRDHWRQQGQSFAATADIYDCDARAAELILGH